MHLLSQNNFADLALHVSVPVFHLVVLSNCSACKAAVASMPPKTFGSDSCFRTLDQLDPWNTGAPSFYYPRN
ncbi:hypothetical protein M404DRAFT_1009024 [Pisolithus tinctorius Marx 270]|uniref:Uncharacterized protein n=1 Tax=Pisolithus tinctorius Marx 270 TaxID=870435 RepID=A0A0C3MWN3_PISTI|nr:hypothetical protein M404DRAFT_1009024 [Pisolithus tinctorius Marx 270]